MIFTLLFSQKRLPNPKTLFSTTQDHRWPPLLAVGPPYQEEHFSRSEILIILLEDLMEKIPQSFISKLL
ncbi:hypothetical protein HKD37_02G003667 [Glycine soja]